MNKNQRSSKKGRRRAAAGLTVCFLTVVGLTGIYTWARDKDQVEEKGQIAEKAEGTTEKNLAALEGDDSLIQPEEEMFLQEQEMEDTQDQQKNLTEEEEKAEESIRSQETAGSTYSVSFSESDSLLWPVDGQVLMSYSMDQTVYFQTLDQYKYNPAMIISGAVNDQVIASAPGIVKSIDETAQTGVTVTLDMGNGYECIYGQLKEVAVHVGEYMEAGNVLGYVSEPTKYYSVEGPNVYFEMRKDAQPINPMEYMAED